MKSSGISTSGALLLIFITLKLTGTITWAWGWVLSPMWVPVAAVIVAVLIGAPFVIMFKAIAERRNFRRMLDRGAK